jgi:hypothetical protein
VRDDIVADGAGGGAAAATTGTATATKAPPIGGPAPTGAIPPRPRKKPKRR